MYRMMYRMRRYISKYRISAFLTFLALTSFIPITIKFSNQKGRKESSSLLITPPTSSVLRPAVTPLLHALSTC